MAVSRRAAKPARTTPNFAATLIFESARRPHKRIKVLDVEFACPPVVGDTLYVEINGAKQHLKKECYWNVREILHEIDIQSEVDEPLPATTPVLTLRVVVRPQPAKRTPFSKTQVNEFARRKAEG